MSGVDNQSAIKPGEIYASSFTVASEKSTKAQYSFSAIMLKLGLRALQGSQETFQAQFTRAQEMVKCMEELNALMQSMNTLKAKFGNDPKADTRTTDENDALQKSINAFNKKYPSCAIEKGQTFLNYDKDKNLIHNQVNYSGFSAMMSNIQTIQSTLSSQNEQQSMRTNQAMSRASGYLQQLQSILQAAKEGLQAAAKAGGS